MKALLRSLSGFILVVMLVTFTLWRNESMPDLSGVNNALKDAMGQVSDLGDLISGEQTPPKGEDDPQDSTPGEPYVAFDPVTGVSEELEAALLAAVTAHEEELDLSEFAAPTENFKTAMTQFFFTHPELFYVATSYRISSKQGSNVVSKVSFEYLYTAGEIPAMKQTYEQALQQIVAGVPTDGTDFDKVLYLHDYFVQNYAYDYAGFRAEQQGETGVAIRDTYNFFTQKKGVCQAYMLALIATANEVGIECLPVISDGMNHAWNLIKLDGEWYHIDVTWDDAGGEQSAVFPSYISYSYFLLSGEALYNSGRTHEWEAMQLADSKIYDDAMWREASTPMLKHGGNYYCMLYVRSSLGSGGYSAVCGGSSPTTVAVLKELGGIFWQPPGAVGTQYVGCFAGIVVYDGKLIFNSADGFYTFDPSSKMVRMIYDLSLTLGNDQIFGICGISGDVITYVRAAGASGEYTEETWTVQNLS